MDQEIVRAGRSRPVSMADVAAVAGVSGQTVSRVVNGSPRVDPATRQRVLEAMDALAYRPNRAAQALRSGRSRTLGVIVTSMHSAGQALTVDAIIRSAHAAGYAVTIVPIEYARTGELTDAIALMVGHSVDGVILAVGSQHPDEEHVVSELPLVVVGAREGYEYPSVDTNQELGARLAVRHLLERGHETVWHISGHPDAYPAQRRSAGWRTALETAGITPPPTIAGDWSADSGYRAGVLLAAMTEVTAIFAANDHMALGALSALHERGRRVPDEVSVVGFDDLAESSSYWPPLTTVHQNFSAVGQAAVHQVVAIIERQAVPASPLIPPVLVVRSSTTTMRDRSEIR